MDQVYSSSLIEAGAPEEIKVTQEMIEAGFREYEGRWCALHDADDVAAREMIIAAYIAMRRLQP